MERLFHCYASAAFGMEGLVSRELKNLGIREVSAENGGVHFTASGMELFRCNLLMHFSDRLFIVLASEQCRSFDALFNLVYAVDWASFFAGTESIDISCRCSRSTLMSPRDCQSITKKAVIEKIRNSRKQSVFPESGPSLSVFVSIRNDYAMIMMNTSGEALSRRGYRTWNGEAPLRETLAAALVELSGWRPIQPLHDPCCGTGTILIEAALIAAGRKPGINRSFAMEHYICFRDIDFTMIRRQLSEETDYSRIREISGSDINPDALELASRHIKQAGLNTQMIRIEKKPLQELTLKSENGVFICNPPYGERLSDQKQCRKLYHDLFMLKLRHPTWRMCVISSDPAFERNYGKKADKKHRLYNGRLECVYYSYD